MIKQRVGENAYWNFPGGRVEFGENPYETLHREVMEEVNLEIEILKPIGLFWFFKQDGKGQVVCNTFLCEAKNNKIDLTKNPANEDILEYRWVTKEEFLKEDYVAGDKSLKDLVASFDF